MADKKPKFSKIKSAGLGALQGASLGFADEVEGGVKALKDVMGDNKNLSDLVDLYTQRRDESRGEYKEAQEENPKSYMGGSLAGALGTAFIPGASALTAGSALGAAGVGAGLGALGGLGSSEASDLEGLAKDTAIGGAIGGVAGPIANKGFDKIKGLVGNKAPQVSAEAARRMQQEMQQAMEAIGESTARLPAKPSAMAKTPEQTKELLSKIKEVEANLPDLIKQAQMRRNTELGQKAQQVRESQPIEESTMIADLMKMLADGQ